MHNDNRSQNPSQSERPTNPSPAPAQKTQDHKTFGNEPEIKDPPTAHQPNQYEVTQSQREHKRSDREDEGQSLKKSEVNQPKSGTPSEKIPPAKNAP